ncbi:MAG TPA: ABC transporter ATP-binding protein [Spirochaetia bacterium]|nr:ABC transporter ATP-binding protein [Spirochaetia bacterium]
MTGPHVRIEGVSKSFGRTRALDNVSLEVPQGSFTTFLGPSGCGKTTLLRTIAGFYEPDSGTISIGGRLMNGVASHLRRAVMVFQDYALFPHLSAAENIVYGLKIRKIPPSHVRERLSRIASRLSVEGVLSQTPMQLSGGQQQRVALARALVMEPEVLLLDEPLSNLDAKLRVSVRAELRRLQKSLGITTIYVTHDQTEALAMSDQVVIMNKGGIVQVDSPRRVYLAPRDPFVASFVGMANLFPARVLQVSPSEVLCETQGLRMRAARPASGLEPGEAVTLSVRPEHIRISVEEPPPSAGSLTVFQGTIVTSLFEGAYVRYWVDTGGHELVVDDWRGENDGGLRGPVYLSFEGHKVHIMPDEDGKAARPSR